MGNGALFKFDFVFDEITATNIRLMFENTSAFRFRRSRNFSKSPSPIFPFKCSISGKTGLSNSSSYDEWRSKKFEQLDKPSSVSDFIENNL